MTAQALYLIDYDANGNWAVRRLSKDFRVVATRSHTELPRWSLRKQQVQGRFPSFKAACERAAALASEYSETVG